jgi:hypothetical protein
MHFQAESIFEKYIASQYQTHTKNMITLYIKKKKQITKTNLK